MGLRGRPTSPPLPTHPSGGVLLAVERSPNIARSVSESASGSHAIAERLPGSNGRAPIAGSLAPEIPRARRGWLVRRMLLGADVIGLLVAFLATELLFMGRNTRVDGVGISVEAAVFVATLPMWVVAAKLYGLYDKDEERATHSTADEFVTVFHLITVGVWVFFAVSWLTALADPNQPKLATFWILSIGAVVLSRSAARAVARRQASYLQNTVIVGAGDIGQLIARKLLQHPEYGIKLLGFLDAEPKELRGDLSDLRVLGPPESLGAIVRDRRVDRVILAFSRERHEELLELVRSLREQNVQIDVVPRLFEAVNAQIGVHSLEGLPLLGLGATRMSRSSRFLKRCLDVAGASLLILAIAPLMALIALLVRRDSPGPILFRQTRLGMNMHEFTLLKFRTMRDGTDPEPHRQYLRQIMDPRAEPGANKLYKLDRPDEVTRVGRWIRKTSLDELPQLFNVLRGDMSLVGPRPSIPYELELYAPHHFERFLVPAGLTGLWQVEARAHSTFAEALDLDAAYARGWSFGLDLRLLARTPLLMLRKRETA
jgi:exopolysaccharide biosynthesis polyprenyl glycosylphosphotransferase